MNELPQRTAQSEAEYGRAERELRLSGETYRAFFQESWDAVCIVTREGRFVEFNQATSDLFGYTSEELARRNVRELYVNPADRDRFQREIEAKGAVQDYEVKLRRKDGTEMDCLFTTTLWRAADGTVLGYRGIIRDITERKQREQALRQRTVYLAALYRMSRAVSEALRLEEVLDTALEVALEVTELDAGTVWLPDPGSIPPLRIAASRGAPPEYPARLQEARRARGRPGIVEDVLHSGKAAFLEDIAQDPRLAFPELLKSFGFVSNAVIPLHHREQALGVLSLLSRTPHAFSRWEKELLLAIGEQVSIALQRAEAEEALRRQTDLLQKTFNTITEALFILNAEVLPRIMDCNEAATAIFGHARAEMLGQTTTFLHVSEETLQKFQSLLYPAIDGGQLYFYLPEFKMKRKDGSIFVSEHSVAQLLDEAGKRIGWVSMVKDITEHKRMEEQLIYAATHDALTGLPNRALLNDRLALELAHAGRNRQKLALLSLDLDHLKEVNDSMGHRMGDQLLRVVGERLKGMLRKSDTVARMGGDEFMLIFPGIVRPEDGATVAQKVLEAVREPFLLEGHEFRITTSIGVAIYPEDGEDVETLMRNADMALYQAKQMGRDNHQRYIPGSAE